MRAAYVRVIERDGGVCQVCRKGADDVGHILPRRFVSLKADDRNLICLCRDCHVGHETVDGRSRLLRLLERMHGYRYPESEFQGYLR